LAAVLARADADADDADENDPAKPEVEPLELAVLHGVKVVLADREAVEMRPVRTDIWARAGAEVGVGVLGRRDDGRAPAAAAAPAAACRGRNAMVLLRWVSRVR
jgi:hypothetical protein